MVQDWVLLTVADLSAVMSPAVIATFNQPDDTGTTRAERMLILTVDNVLAAIASSSRVALSLTTGPVSVTNTATEIRAIPPQAKYYTLVLAANAIISGQPTMDGYAASDSWKALVKRATDWLEDDASGGKEISEPSDPDPDTVSSPTATFSAVSEDGDVDMTTDGPP